MIKKIRVNQTRSESLGIKLLITIIPYKMPNTPKRRPK